MSNTVQILFGLFGGLAVFIYGMNMMSECLQKAAGEKMKAVLALLTKNPVLGVLAGALTTAVLQRYDSHGDRLCQRRPDDAATGDLYYFWCEYRNDDDSTDHSI